MKQQHPKKQQPQDDAPFEPITVEEEINVPDLSDPEEAAQAFIAAEIFNRKY